MAKIILALEFLMDLITFGGTAYYRYRKERRQIKEQEKA